MIVRVTLIFLVMPLMGLDAHAAVGMLDIEGLKSGVVRITATEGNKTKVGTGFIVKLDSESVYIVTAAHVVAGDSQPKVQFFTQQDVQIQATVKHIEGSDDVTALALLVIRGKGNIPSGLAAMFLAISARFGGAEQVLVIGHPRQAGEWAVLTGAIVSRQGRYITIDANIDEGNSGGPIIHIGQVVGLIGGAQGYGKGVTIGTVREYLEGHGVLVQAPMTQGAAAAQAPVPKELTSKDGAPMALIPAGEFWMGSSDGEGNKDEHPRHKVALSTFYLDKYEVTVARYAEFVRVKSRPKPTYWDQVDSSTHRNLPIVGVDWHDAKAYCEWAGKRLPTEAEWEKAARGTDGRMYPWGNEQPAARLANFGKGFTANVYDQGLAPVDSYEAGKSPYGLHHMAGNGWEWVADWYDEVYYKNSPERNPKGPSGGEYRVLRGGSLYDAPVDVRSAYRYWYTPSDLDYRIGFRCAQDAVNPALAEELASKDVPNVAETLRAAPAYQCSAKPITKLKRKTEVFVPQWRVAIERMKAERNIHDLQNLFEIWGRIPVGLTGEQLVAEARYTVDCLATSGHVATESSAKPGQYWGVQFDNISMKFKR